MLVEMLKTAAGPDFVLDAGSTYNVPRSIAKVLLAEDGTGFPAAREPRGKPKRVKPFGRPDPEEREVDDVDAMDEELVEE